MRLQQRYVAGIPGRDCDKPETGNQQAENKKNAGRTRNDGGGILILMENLVHTLPVRDALSPMRYSIPGLKFDSRRPKYN